MSHPVNWFQIGGPNGHALQKFYEQAFGWSLQNIPGDPGDMKMVAAGKDGIPGGVGTTQSKQPSVAVYISVGDIDAQFGKIQRAGGRMAMPKTELPAGMGSIAGFTDPAGNWIGLWMPAKSAPPAKKASATAKRPPGKKASASTKKASTTKTSSSKKASAKKPAKTTKAKARSKKR